MVGFVDDRFNLSPKIGTFSITYSVFNNNFSEQNYLLINVFTNPNSFLILIMIFYWYGSY